MDSLRLEHVTNCEVITEIDRFHALEYSGDKIRYRIESMQLTAYFVADGRLCQDIYRMRKYTATGAIYKTYERILDYDYNKGKHLRVIERGCKYDKNGKIKDQYETIKNQSW